jgi:2-phosphosulfolactate phosphatase
VPHAQSRFDVRFEWGLRGVTDVANHGGVTIIVDVLSFSTCVDVAVARGAEVFPYTVGDTSAAEFASTHGAQLASRRSLPGPTLSPASLTALGPGDRLVLPSPNGSTLTLSCTSPAVLAGCLRNARAVADYAARQNGPITVIAAGERWPDHTLRPALEDLIASGCIIQALQGSRSPEANAAVSCFDGASHAIAEALLNCASGLELIEKGFRGDVEMAVAVDVSRCVPRFAAGRYCNAV